jgi:hypothetical protein
VPPTEENSPSQYTSSLEDGYGTLKSDNVIFRIFTPVSVGSNGFKKKPTSSDSTKVVPRTTAKTITEPSGGGVSGRSMAAIPIKLTRVHRIFR